MQLLRRGYRGDEDYWRIRQFLRNIFRLNDRREVSWPVMRWDYWRWPGVESWGDGPLEGRVFIWEGPDGQMAAALNPESRGQAYLQVHPQWRSAELVSEMLDTAERYLARASADGRPTVSMWTDLQDSLQQDLLRQDTGEPVALDWQAYCAGPIK